MEKTNKHPGEKFYKQNLKMMRQKALDALEVETFKPTEEMKSKKMLQLDLKSSQLREKAKKVKAL